MNSDTLLVFQSKRGTALQAAQWVAEDLGSCDVIDLKNNFPGNIDNYDRVIIGSGIMAGNAYGRIRNFIKSHRSELLNKKLFLFITHLEDDPEKDFVKAFDEEILSHAIHRAGLGGRLKLENLNFLMRMVMKKIGEENGKDISNFDSLSRESCRGFAEKVKSG